MDPGLLLPFAALVVLAFLYLRRLEEMPAANYWAPAWVVLYGAGTLVRLDWAPDALIALGHLLGSLFPALLLAGALAFAERPVPPVIIAAGCALGAARAVLWLLGYPQLATGIAIPLELPFTLGTVWVALRFAFKRSATFADRVLPPAFLAVAALNFADPLGRIGAIPFMPLLAAWLAVSIMVVLLQILALVERLRSRERRLLDARELLRRIARSATDHSDPRLLLDAVVTEVRERTGFDAFGVWLLSADARSVELIRAIPKPESLPDELRYLPVDLPMIGEALRSRDPVFMEDIRTDPRVVREEARGTGLAAAAFASLRGQGRTIGLLTAGLRPGRRFDAEDQRLVATLAEEIGLVVSHVRSVEEREQQARVLDGERRQLANLVENVPAGIMLVDRRGRITVMNRVAAKQFGFGDPQDWIGRRAAETISAYEERLPPGELQRVLAAFPPEDSGLRVESFELHIARPEERILVISVRPVQGIDGSRLGQLWVSRDVTEERRLAYRLQQTERLDTLGTLAGGVAHDFNNQLTVILGNARLLRDAMPNDPDLCASLEDLETSAERCTDLTRGLLTFARQAPPTPRSVELSAALREVEGVVRTSLPPDIRLEVAVSPGTRRVLADPTQLQRVLINLAMNARDAVRQAGRDGGRIVLEARNRSAPLAAAQAPGVRAGGDFVEIAVRDTGVGMDSAWKDRIFDPFFTTKPVGEGTGLGLAIVYGILESHGGAIEVESEPGSGSLFRLLWPAADAVGEAMEERSEGPSPRGHETVLLAEDEESVRTVARVALERRGFRVLDTCDGEEALSRFTRHRDEVALAVLDLKMPRRDGLSALAAMRDLVPALPALLMSGHLSPQNGERLPDDVEMLPKPFVPDDLARRVREILDRPSTRRDARDASSSRRE